MKRNDLVVSSLQLNNTVEKYVRNKDAELKTLAEKIANYFAEQRQPLSVGDSIEPYTGELKSGYEQLNAEVRVQLQPNANFPEGKIDLDHFREKEKVIEVQINDLLHQNRNDIFELGKYDAGSVYTRVLIAAGSTFIITVGEIVFNTKAFQVTGENLLFALVLSICVSFGVFIFSHIVSFMYKAAVSVRQRASVMCGSLLLVTGLFTALAVFRSTYLAMHDVTINPIFFILINLFFFIVSALISFFVMPTWEKIKQNTRSVRLYVAIGKRNKQIEKLKQNKETLREVITNLTKERIRIIYLSNHYAECIRKMYAEAIAIFKRVNCAQRRDGKIPDCFNAVPVADIHDVEINGITTNRNLS